MKKNDATLIEPSSAAPNASDLLQAQQSLLPLLRYLVAALLLTPILIVLALRPVLTHAPVNILGPSAIFVLGLTTWYLISVHKINAAIELGMVGIWLAVTGIAIFTGALQSPVMVVYPVMILLTGWLVNVRYAKLMTGLTVVTTLVLWLAEQRQWLPVQFAPSAAVYAVNQTSVVVLSEVLIVFVVRVFKLRLKQLYETRARLKMQALALKQSEDRYRAMIEWSPEAILVHRQGTLVYANPAAVKLFGAPDAATLLAKKTSDLIHPDDRAAQIERMKSIIRQENIAPFTEARFLTLDGAVIDVQVQGTAIDFDREPAIHVSIHDITERKKLEHEIRQLAFYDALTQLPNRRLLDDRLKQVLSASKRHGSYSALMFLDLDNFKPLNDSHGHVFGDALLIEVAARLKQCVRETDTVARFGGDEFIVLIPELSLLQTESTKQAMDIAEKIRNTLSAPYSLNRQPLAIADLTHQCTVSVGVVVFMGDRTRAQDLLAWADAAMYQAKAEGRNRVHLFQEPAA
ncbi:MAG: hypothetical protein CO105_01020 [Comamonadaceae bacterium CG_4_9_14_3_um_filter_60_33]|nr:MAG: hypothetical protein AUK51_01940 [Comamonadaceae bacterium CG2_30_59_20]PIY27789.1 MAG: hypothetical protein COZ09_13300 [Comamonadaceae bacterium CG_4_10_14_3_um_filter_60_42]PJB46631.1 MAG: hypothetical protein CO105_01020 [Comamonadaceae bacterium CG_4_9_14_3_um_filter_60_33]